MANNLKLFPKDIGTFIYLLEKKAQVVLPTWLFSRISPWQPN